MTATRYRKLAVFELVIEFETLGLAQYEANEREEIGRYNKLFERISLVLAELKSRPNDERRALQALFGKGNLQVRLMAAKANLAIDYDSARRELEAVVATRRIPQAAEADMTLDHLDSGFYRPT